MSSDPNQPDEALNPDGFCAALLLTAALDKTARVWDVLTGNTPVVFWGHEFRIRFASFRSDVALVATISEVGIWRILGSILYRIRFAEREANARCEDELKLLKPWLDEVRGVASQQPTPSSNRLGSLLPIDDALSYSIRILSTAGQSRRSL